MARKKLTKLQNLILPEFKSSQLMRSAEKRTATHSSSDVQQLIPSPSQLSYSRHKKSATSKNVLQTPNILHKTTVKCQPGNVDRICATDEEL